MERRRRQVVSCWMPKTRLVSVLHLLSTLIASSSTTAAAFNGVPGNTLRHEGSGHWTNRRIRNDPDDDPQWPLDRRSTDGKPLFFDLLTFFFLKYQ